MKRKIKSILIIFTIVLITILLLLYPDDVLKSVLFSIKIWKENVFPSLFPFFIISYFLINYGFIDFLGELTKNVMAKLFYLPGEASFVILGSMISGFPSSGKYIKDIYDKKLINEKEASYLLSFTHFSNPLFIVGTIGINLLHNKNIGFVILIIHILSNFIIAFIFRPKENKYKNNSTVISLNKALDKAHHKIMNNNFGIVLSNSINNTINTLLSILGIICVFLVLSKLINNLFSFNSLVNSAISGILEMTGGVNNISLLNLPNNLKASLITFIISFGGLSVHAQIISIISDTPIKYKYYLISRIYHAFISSSLVFLILNFINY